MKEKLYDLGGFVVCDIEDSSAVGWIKDDMITTDQFKLKDIQFEDGDVVIDIGAHVGIVTAFLAKNNPGITVYAIEPQKENYERLVKTIQANNLTNVTALNLAITEDGRRVCMSPLGGNTGGCDMFHKGEPNTDSITLDRLISRHQIEKVKLLKMDCEGAEYEIIHSFQGWDKIEHLAMEFHPVSWFYYPRGYSKQAAAELIKSKMSSHTLVGVEA